MGWALVGSGSSVGGDRAIDGHGLVGAGAPGDHGPDLLGAQRHFGVGHGTGIGAQGKPDLCRL